MKTPLRGGWGWRPLALDDVPDRNADQLSGGAGPQCAGLEKPVRSLVCSGLDQGPAQPYVSGGLRQEFTTGWNEKSGRASNYITGANGVLLTPPLVGDSVFTQNNAKKLFSPGRGWRGTPSVTRRRRSGPASELIIR